jgi:hypothetical protein
MVETEEGILVRTTTETFERGRIGHASFRIGMTGV